MRDGGTPSRTAQTGMQPLLVLALAIVCALSSIESPAWAVCGDGVVDGTESCDGADLGGRTCSSVTDNFVPVGQGTLLCNPDCTLDTTDCRRVFIETLIPASKPARNRCHIEWGAVGTSAGRGRASKRQCIDGDPTCDRDGQFNSACAIGIEVCMNVPDPRIGDCTPNRIFRLQVLQPKLTTELGQQVASAVLAAASNAAPGSSAIASGAVSYSPPLTEFACGKSTVTVPLRGSAGRARLGKVRIKARTSDNSGRVRANAPLTLICMP
jgi:hypothetical protein